MKERLRPLTEGLAYDVLGGTLYSLGFIPLPQTAALPPGAFPAWR